MKYLLVLVFLVMGFYAVQAQNPLGRLRNLGSGIGNSSASSDTLGRRNANEDSITITFRYLDSARIFKLDSSVLDFTSKYPIPATHYSLGNTGSPAQSYLFSPRMKIGWDAGFHSLDIYKYTVDKAKLFNVTRPYSELNYLIAARSEQYIEILHTQNIKPNWNASISYRLINTPGFFNNQHSSHSNYLFTNWVKSKNNRYHNIIIVASNKQQNAENGGIIEKDANGFNYLKSANYLNRRLVPTYLGADAYYQNNFFNTKVNMGNKYNDMSMVMRQHYDLFGKKDSLITDSVVYPLFYPTIRIEHTIQYNKNKYEYIDGRPNMNYYKDKYALNLSNNNDTVHFNDDWRNLINDFSIYSFPNPKNTLQFIKLGAAFQMLKGRFLDTATVEKDNELFIHGEYRNRTRNKKWDLNASAKLYLLGMVKGDYEASAYIQRTLGEKLGSIKLGFHNANKSPAFYTNELSSFYLQKDNSAFKKENIIQIYADTYQPRLKMNLTGSLYLLNNYIFITDFYKINQQTSPFNILQIAANKVIAFGKKKQWKWWADVYFQQKIGNAPVNLPMIYTRQRIGLDGNAGYRKLKLATGLEFKYRTPYKANQYSPILGQFFYQDTETVAYKMPDINAYLHFRINSLTGYLRFENLNSFGRVAGYWGFYNHNQSVSGYPYPGMVIRFGVFWGFVN